VRRRRRQWFAQRSRYWRGVGGELRAESDDRAIDRPGRGLRQRQPVEPGPDLGEGGCERRAVLAPGQMIEHILAGVILG
jgi:hypothetical protein